MNQLPVAIITGASSGIGRAAAIRLAEAGYHVVLIARTESNLTALATELGDARTTIAALDVADATALTRCIESVIAHHGRVDALINVAGFAILKPLAETSLSDWQTSLDVNLTAPFVATKAVWPAFTKQQHGIVINISSMASKDPFPGFGAYASAKVALNMLTLMIAREGQPIGIKALAIAPGAVETPMLRGLFNTQMLPENQTLDPDELGCMIRDCITGTRPFESGQTLFVSK